MRLLRCALIACLFACFGCDIDSVTGLNFEILTVSVTTTGANLDSDGYRLSITSLPAESIGINESRSFRPTVNDVTVELLDIAANCIVDTNPKRVNVSGPTTMGFFVECS